MFASEPARLHVSSLTDPALCRAQEVDKTRYNSTDASLEREIFILSEVRPEPSNSTSLSSVCVARFYNYSDVPDTFGTGSPREHHPTPMHIRDAIESFHRHRACLGW